MKKRIAVRQLSCLLVALAVAPGLSQQQKLAQTGLKFLTVATDARATAMGEATATMTGSSAALFFNPAGIARLPTKVDIALGRVEWIADINYSYGSLAFNPGDGQYGVFGVSFLSVDYGEVYGTIRADNEAGFLDTGTFRPTALSVGLGYAKALTDKFSVGGNVRFVKQDLKTAIIGFGSDGSQITTANKVDVLAFDLGIIYRTGFKSLDFGMNVRNFSEEIKYQDETFQLPLIFAIGLSMNAMDLLTDAHSPHDFVLAVEATHPRDYPEQVKLGGEYVFLNAFALRAGYLFPSDEHHFSVGAGFRKGNHLALDYAYTPFGLFDQVHRFSVKFAY
ncbi:MAG: PorV/PorQ family protein [candidate division KSB1 bacterium]|nr:PorV/PorQ family protein [candidate division KSB1 bacterium]MDZ7272948.1 PorV/PorQ family protein [candidate division KSB1 bacterium]MDZ7285052.1 PorV/PorQ family protein [candidate division KSB1 bacterium]MDZ7298084.1 PorV/PorQ family protein [candidate division KSB1 bacterium]MDZ7309222.1 PorV/PorQ family protein [candidate division KSB1 bacterium]